MASLSDQLSVVSQGLSLHSQQISVLSQAVSVLSQQTSAISQQVSALSQAHSALSQAVSVISAGLGGIQLRQVTGAQVISATAFTKVSGLSLSLAANANYRVEGCVLWTTSILTGTRFGFVYPGANQMVGSMTMETIVTTISSGAAPPTTSAGYVQGRLPAASMSTVATAQISVLGGASATEYQLEIYGLIRATSAGVIELQASQSATGGGVQILAGSYIRAYKIT